MSDCQFNSRMGAYHDGELDAASSRQIELHLAGCPSCSRALEQLRSVSRAMSAFDPGDMTPIELSRLHRELNRAEEGSLIRFSTVLATMAASVLIISLAWIAQMAPKPAPTATTVVRPLPQWERIAMGEAIPNPVQSSPFGEPRMPDSGVASLPQPQRPAAAGEDTINWMLNGLSGLNVHENR